MMEDAWIVSIQCAVASFNCLFDRMNEFNYLRKELANKPMDEKKFMIIDTDCGVDDAAALLMALGNFAIKSNWHVLAITTVSGNASIDFVNENVLKKLKNSVLDEYINYHQLAISKHIMQELSKEEVQDEESEDAVKIPVYPGAKYGLLKRSIEDNFHGHDGLGGVACEFTKGNLVLQKENAVMKMVELANLYKNKVTLVALGPLTNLALAQRIDHKFFSNLKELYIMGGTINALGNCGPAAEFNFASDPEAADIVLNESACKITILPWETCVNPGTSKFSWRTHVESEKYAKEVQKLKSYRSCDSWLMAIVLDEQVIAEKFDWYARVEQIGAHTRGQMIVDKRAKFEGKTNVTVATKLNMKNVMELTYDMLD
ncbi:putative uridine nucleosidase 2 [Nymphon striatum]|nr:putative uridine nucleosidase 2 [Nymphon striatum]